MDTTAEEWVAKRRPGSRGRIGTTTWPKRQVFTRFCLFLKIADRFVLRLPIPRGLQADPTEPEVRVLAAVESADRLMRGSGWLAASGPEVYARVVGGSRRRLSAHQTHPQCDHIPGRYHDQTLSQSAGEGAEEEQAQALLTAPSRGRSGDERRYV